MTYTIVTLEEMIVVGKSVRTTNQGGRAMRDIGSLWQNCMNNGVLNSIPNRIDGQVMGLYTAYEKDANAPYTFLCCCQVSQAIDTDLDKIIIPSGTYAKFSIEGNAITAVGRAWGKIWQMDLNRRYDYDFEVYHNNTEDTNHQKIDIYISIEPCN